MQAQHASALAPVEPVLEDIERRLSVLQPHRVILFGSYAWGNPRKDSDIDLVVVLDAEHLPTSFAERLDLHHHVRKQLRSINYERPMDLLVYTKAEWKRLVDLEGMVRMETTWIISKTEVADLLKPDLLARLREVEERLALFERTYEQPFDQVEQRMLREKEDFGRWDDYVEWKAYRQFQGGLRQRLSALRRGDFKVH